MSTKQHWTAENTEDFRFRVAFDFVTQLEEYMANGQISRKALAAKLGVSQGRVSQVLNDPGNLTLRLMVEWARRIGQKVAVVLYDDDDSGDLRGPIFSSVFRECWEHMGKPHDIWQIGEITTGEGAPIRYESCDVVYPKCWGGREALRTMPLKVPHECSSGVDKMSA